MNDTTTFPKWVFRPRAKLFPRLDWIWSWWRLLGVSMGWRRIPNRDSKGFELHQRWISRALAKVDATPIANQIPQNSIYSFSISYSFPRKFDGRNFFGTHHVLQVLVILGTGFQRHFPQRPRPVAEEAIRFDLQHWLCLLVKNDLWHVTTVKQWSQSFSHQWSLFVTEFLR